MTTVYGAVGLASALALGTYLAGHGEAAPGQSTQSKCSLAGDNYVSDTHLELHQTATVTTALVAPCAIRQVAIAIGQQTYDNDGTDASMREEVATWLRTVDLIDAEVALVATNPARTTHPLSQDTASLLNRVFVGGSREGDAVGGLIGARLELLRGQPFGVRDQAILLLTGKLYAGQAGSAVREANLSKVHGTDIFVVGVYNSSQTGVEPLATSPRHFFGFESGGHLRPEQYLAGVARATQLGLRAVEETFRRHAFETVVVTSTLPSGFTYVTGSSAPPATWNAVLRQLTWTFADPPITSTLGFDVRPLACGTYHLPETTQAWGRDRSGTEYAHDFGSSEVNVPCPTATPTPTVPSPTPSPEPTATGVPTSTAEPTATAVPQPLFIPIALREAPCSQVRRAAVALAIDTSSSMLELTNRGRTKLEAATTAADAFLDLLVFPHDQAAIVGFDTDVDLVQTLSSDRAHLGLALSRLTSGSGTNIAAGVAAGHAELTSPRRLPGNLAVLILMTDGRAQDGSEPSLAAASAAKADGLALFTIGLGADVDRSTLAAMASRPDWYYEAASAEDLTELYQTLAIDLPCPADRYWGRR